MINKKTIFIILLVVIVILIEFYKNIGVSEPQHDKNITCEYIVLPFILILYGFLVCKYIFDMSSLTAILLAFITFPLIFNYIGRIKNINNSVGNTIIDILIYPVMMPIYLFLLPLYMFNPGSSVGNSFAGLFLDPLTKIVNI